MELFDFKDHYSYLIYRFKTTHRKRGSKLAFSKYLNIQQAFLSQVLKKQYALNLEHADLANYFFGHSSEEADFFLLLVNNDRSGTDSLKKYFQEKINIALKNRLLVIERIGKKHMLSGEEQGIYYSSWLYAAVHIACTISQFQTLHSLSSYLNIPYEKCLEILKFLTSINLIRKEADLYKSTNNWVRLDNQSPHIIKHHSNWRQKTIQNLEFRNDLDLHFSGIYSLNVKYASSFKSHMLNFLKQHTKEMEMVSEEELFILGIDFFKLIKNNNF